MQRKHPQEARQDDRPARPQGSPAPHHTVDGTELNGASATPGNKRETLTHAPEGIPMVKEVAELGMVSGLSWDDLGRIFGVSRQRMLFWVSGQRLDAATVKFVMQVLEVARHADRGRASLTRAVLHDASKGTSPFELLVEHRFDDAREALGPALEIKRSIFSKDIGETERILPEPIPPHILANALEDSIHKEVGRTRVVPSYRKKRRDDP